MPVNNNDSNNNNNNNIYYNTSLAATHVSALHQQMDHHKTKPATNSFMPSGEGGQEKYFQPNVRSHLALPVTRVLPVQQPHPGVGQSACRFSGHQFTHYSDYVL